MAVVLFFLSPLHSALPGENLTVSYRGKSKELPARTLHGYQVFDLDELTRILGGTLTVIQEELTVEWQFSGETIEFSHGSPLYRAGRRVYNLPTAPGFDGGSFLVPVRFLTRDLEELFPDIFIFDAAAGELRDIRDFAHLKSFRVEVDPNSTYIGLLTTSPVKFALDNTKPGSFLLNLYDTRISSAIEDSVSQVGYVDSVEVIPYADGVQLLFHLNDKAGRYRVAETTQPTGLSVTFFGQPLDGVKSPVVSTVGSPPVTEHRDYTIKSIMIDPGHGGKDPGAVAGRTLYEKDINLKISKMLAEMLELEGFHVTMTRENDTFVPLSSRTRLANENSSDIFVSVHCNSSASKNLNGFEVYFLSEAKTDEERTVAHRENMSLKYERPDLDPATLGDIQFIFWDLAQNEFLTESYECAQTIVQEVSHGLDVERCHVKQAGFYVLNGVYMPSVLIEMAYLSNSEDRARITSDAYLKKMIRHLSSGITEYIHTYNAKVSG